MMRGFTLYIVSFLLCTACVRAEVITPVADVATPSTSTVHGLAVMARQDGTALPALDGILSLQDCVDIALANSPQMVAARLEAQNARVNLHLAQSQLLPTASAQWSSRYDMGSSVHDAGTSDASATAQLTLSGLTDTARNIRMKRLAVDQADLRVQSVQNDIVRSVRKGYYALLAAQRTVDIRTQSRAVYQDQYDRTSEYYRLGLRPKVDVTTAEVNLNNESLRLIRATNAVKTASASLANLLGITTPHVLQVEDVDDFALLELPFEQAVQTAYDNRPDVQSARLDERISQLQVSQAKAGYLPTLGLSAGYTQSASSGLYLDGEYAHVGVSLDIPIFNAFKTHNAVKQASISQEKTQNATRNLLNNVFLEVQNAYIKMDEAAQSIPLAKLNVEKAHENMELARGRYNEGIGDIIALKDAESAYTDAELSLLTARYDYAAAVADLKQSMGTY